PAGLDYPEVADTGLLEPSTGEQTREAAADNNYLDLFRQRFAHKALLDVRVIFCVMGELPGQLDVLRFTIVAEALVALLAVLFAQRGGIEIQPCFCSLDRIRCIGVDTLVIVGSARSLDWRCPERAAVDLRPSTRRFDANLIVERHRDRLRHHG